MMECYHGLIGYSSRIDTIFKLPKYCKGTLASFCCSFGHGMYALIWYKLFDAYLICHPILRRTKLFSITSTRSNSIVSETTWTNNGGCLQNRGRYIWQYQKNRRAGLQSLSFDDFSHQYIMSDHLRWTSTSILLIITNLCSVNFIQSPPITTSIPPRRLYYRKPLLHRGLAEGTQIPTPYTE